MSLHNSDRKKKKKKNLSRYSSTRRTHRLPVSLDLIQSFFLHSCENACASTTRIEQLLFLQTNVLFPSSLSSSSHFILCCLPAPDVDQTDKHSAASSASSASDIASKLPQCAETDITAIYRHLVQVMRIDAMNTLADKLLAPLLGTNDGHDKVKASMPSARENTDALFLETLLEMVRKHNRSAPIGEMIYKAMVEFIPAVADDCKSVLFEADKKNRSPATHHEDDDKDDEDATPLSDIPSEPPPYEHDVLLLLQAANEHAQLHSKQQQKSNVVIQRLLSHGLNLRGVHLSHSQCQAVGNVLQTHGQHCGPVVNLSRLSCRQCRATAAGQRFAAMRKHYTVRP